MIKKDRNIITYITENGILDPVQVRIKLSFVSLE